MIKNILYLSIIPLLISCAPPSYEQSQPEIWKYTEQGIRVGVTEGTRMLDLQKVDEAYQIISACVANTFITPDFTVVTQQEPIIINGMEVQGVTWSYSNSPDIVYIHYPYWRQEGVAISILSHEMIHVVLKYIGESEYNNTNHVSPAFRCAF